MMNRKKSLQCLKHVRKDQEFSFRITQREMHLKHLRRMRPMWWRYRPGTWNESLSRTVKWGIFWGSITEAVGVYEIALEESKIRRKGSLVLSLEKPQCLQNRQKMAWYWRVGEAGYRKKRENRVRNTLGKRAPKEAEVSVLLNITEKLSQQWVKAPDFPEPGILGPLEGSDSAE